MISDNERREVAEKLRERTKKPMGKSMQRMFTETLGMYAHNICWMNPDKATNRWDVIVNYLADLIDRPTCSIKRESRNGYPTTWGVCSRCGAIVNAERAVSNVTEYLPTRYCPNCGAEVMD